VDADSERALRTFEAQLDQHHLGLALWKYPREQALYSVLAVADSLFLTQMVASDRPPTDGFAQEIKLTHEAASQAIRWLAATSKSGISVMGVTDCAAIGAALEYLGFASHYVNIADFHMMLGRGLAQAVVDKDSKTVTFAETSGPGLSAAAGWHELAESERKRARSAAQRPGSGVAALMRRALSYSLRDGHVEVHGLLPQLMKPLRHMIQTVAHPEIVPLPDDADLVGFSMSDFRRFRDAIVCWSLCAIFGCVEHVRAGVPQNETMPTQIVDINHFITSLVQLSRLKTETVEAILRRLTYVAGTRADILLQPFLIGENRVSWSPSLVVQTRHERNMLKLMARGDAELKAQADNLIGGREKVMIAMLSDRLSKYGYQSKARVRIGVGSDGQTEIDLLAYKRQHPDQVLLIEAKAILAPDEINEVSAATQTLVYAQSQLRAAIETLSCVPSEQKAQLFRFVDWAKVKDIYPIVVAAEGEPHVLLDPQGIPAISMATLRTRLRSCDMSCPKRIWSCCVHRPWLPKEMPAGCTTFDSIVVGDITYRLPMMVAGEHQDGTC